MAQARSPVPEGHYTVTPILTLDRAAEAIDWYKKALGADEVSRATAPDGKIMHAELRIGNSRIMLHDAMMGSVGPKALGGSPAGLWLYVEDCDTLFNRAVSAGAQVKMPMADQFWGDRCGTLEDPHGYGWSIATHKEDLTREEMEQRQADWMKQFAQQPATSSGEDVRGFLRAPRDILRRHGNGPALFLDQHRVAKLVRSIAR